MTQDNSQQGHQNNAVVNSSNEDKQAVQEQTIPLAKFLELKDTLKEFKTKLSSYEEKEKQLQESKLLEEKNYQELLTKRDEELKTFKSQLEQERKAFKLNTTKEKFARFLDKNNAVDSNDVLRLVDIEKFVDLEHQDDAIAKQVEDLKKSKAYLFKSSTSVVNHNENNRANGNTDTQRKPNTKKDKVLDIWMN